MKKIIILFFLILVSPVLFAQGPFPTDEQMKAFKESKTLVVLDKDPFSVYNAAIKEAVKATWTITPYEFVSYEEFRKHKKDPAYSFLLLTSTAFEKDRAGVNYDFLNLLLGDPVNNLSKLPEFCSFPLAYSGSEEADYVPKLPVILRFIQKHVANILKNPGSISLKYRYLKYYNVNMQLLADKELWLAKEDLAPEINTEGKIKAVYPHAFRLVTEDEIDEALAGTPDAKMAFLFKVGPEGTSDKGRVYKMILGTDGTLYYFSYHLLSKKKPDAFLASDLKRLGKF
jgi:hypothetical protein